MKYGYWLFLCFLLGILSLESVWACHKGGPMGFANRDPGELLADITYSPSFSSGSTSGTSGCEDWNLSEHWKHQRLNFLMSQWEPLSTEGAKGHGHHLQALARLMGCSHEQQSSFEQLIQTNFDPLFGKTTTPPTLPQAEQFFVHLEQLIQTQPFSQSCHLPVL